MAIRHVLTNLGVEQYINNWVINILKISYVESWQQQYLKNSTLVSLDIKRINLVVYAGDVVITVRGPFLDVIRNIMIRSFSPSLWPRSWV